MSNDRQKIDDGELTTADLVGQRGERQGHDPQPRPPERPAMDMQQVQSAEPQQVEPSGMPDEIDEEGPAPLFPSDHAEQLHQRWTAIQSGFVDEPRRSVEDADSLVAAAIRHVAETFADERSRLESQWDRGDDVSTEDLRVALRRYRSFFDRILSM